MPAAITSLGILCLVPVIAVWFAARLAWSRLRGGEAEDWTLYRLNRFIRYFHTLYLLPFMLFSASFGVLVTHSIHPKYVQFFVAMMIAVLYFVVVKCAYTLITFKLRKQVHAIQLNRWRAIRGTAVQSGLTAFIYAVMFYALALPPQAWSDAHQWLIAWAITAYFLIISVFGAEFAPWFMRAKRMPPQDVPAAWTQALEQTNLKPVQFYIWPTRKSRTLNAMATGFFRRKIIVADYLLDTMTDEEAMAVVFHELGHHNYRHLWRGLVLTTGWIPLVQIAYSVMQVLHVPGGLAQCLLFIGFGAYYGLLVNWVMRRFEFQADAFAVQFTGTHMAASLETLTTDSKSPPNISRFDELWMTHPSSARRIERALQLTAE